MESIVQRLGVEYKVLSLDQSYLLCAYVCKVGWRVERGGFWS
jgi:hypothetical protein